MTGARFRDPARSILCGVFLIYLAFLPPIVIAPDERSMIAVALAMLDGDVAVPDQMGTRGPDGRTYSNWYPLNSVVAIPAAALARPAAGWAGLEPLYVTAPLAIAISALATALSSALIYGVSRRLGARGGEAIIVALGYAFGTIALVYGRSFFADSFLALLAIIGLCAISRPRAGALTGLVGALSVLAKPTGVVVGATLGAYLCWNRQWRAAALSVAGTALGLVIYGIYNFARFGNPLLFGQRWDGFTMCCIGEAIAGLTVSPGRGLLWYCPLAGLGLIAARLHIRRNRLLVAVLGVFLGFLGLHSVWGQWPGGWSWGPRLLLPAVPGLVAAAGLAPRRLVLVFAICGVLVNAPLLVSSYQHYTALANDRSVPADAQIWSFAEAPLLHAWASAGHQIRAASRIDPAQVVRESGRDDARAADAEIYRIVPVWWWMLPAVGVSRIWGAACALSMAAAGLQFCRRAWSVRPREFVD